MIRVSGTESRRESRECNDLVIGGAVFTVASARPSVQVKNTRPNPVGTESMNQSAMLTAKIGRPIFYQLTVCVCVCVCGSRKENRKRKEKKKKKSHDRKCPSVLTQMKCFSQQRYYSAKCANPTDCTIKQAVCVIAVIRGPRQALGRPR